MQKKWLCLIALLLAALCCMPAQAQVVELPWDNSPGLEYDRSNYTSATTYEDPSIKVEVFPGGRIHDTDYVYAIIQIASPTQLRTTMAKRYNSDYTVPGTVMAKANNAIFAINGDFFNFNTHGYLVRQGTLYRERPNKNWDLLMIDQNGDFHPIAQPSKKKIADWQAAHPDLKVVNSFNFGPVLMENGARTMAKFKDTPNYFQIAGHKQYARMAICQLDKLTYLCVSCDSVLDENSSGMTLDQFVECLEEVDGKIADYDIQVAYNIDGGGSSTMVFADEKINSLTNPKIRSLCDLVYFASAWQE